MQLTKQDLEEFKAIYKGRFNIELNDKQALEYGNNLVNLIKLLLLTK